MENQLNKEPVNLTLSMTSYADIIFQNSVKLQGGLHTSENLSRTSLLHEVIITLLTLILLSGLLTNSIFFVVFYRQAKLRSFSNRFVLCLCISHLLQSFLITPFTLASVISQSWVFGEIWCQVTGVISLSLTMATVLSLLMIAIDRNYAVNSPLHYSRTVTKSRTSLFILFIWTISLMSSLPPLCGIGTIKYRPDWHTCTVVWTAGNKYTAMYSVYLLIAGFVIPFSIMTCIYFSMYRAAKHNSARARRHSINSSCKQSIFGSSRKSSTRRRSSCASQSSLFGEEWKAAKTGIFVVFSFLVCWLPLFSVILIETFSELGRTIPEGVISLAILLSFSACIINPYLYVYRSKTTRSQLKKMLHLCSSGNRNKSSTYAQNRKFFVPPMPSSTFKLPVETICISPWQSIAIYGRKTEHHISSMSSPIERTSRSYLEQGILRNHLLNAMDLDISVIKSSNRKILSKYRTNAVQNLSIDSIEENDVFRNYSQDRNKVIERCDVKTTLSRTKSMAVFSTLVPRDIISQVGCQRRRSFVMTRYRVKGSDETTSTSLESQEAPDCCPSTNITSDLSGRERRLLFRQWNRSGSEDGGYISRRSSTSSIVSSDSDNIGHMKCLEV